MRERFSGVSRNEGPKAPEGRQQLGIESSLKTLPRKSSSRSQGPVSARGIASSRPEERWAGQVGALRKNGVQSVASPFQLALVHGQCKGHIRRLRVHTKALQKAHEMWTHASKVNHKFPGKKVPLQMHQPHEQHTHSPMEEPGSRQAADAGSNHGHTPLFAILHALKILLLSGRLHRVNFSVFIVLVCCLSAAKLFT
eukprot:1156347-Pelagomonas_calceolata.AAC.12